MVEGIIVGQLSQCFGRYFSKYIPGARKGRDCQGVLLRFNESIKSHLYNNITAAVFTDLSFDCL